jgi:Fic family protein
MEPKADWAFIPAELPPNWKFPERLWPLVAEARHALGTLNGIGQTLDDPNLLLRPLQRREALTSSRLEGTYVTPEQLLLYELDPDKPRSETGRVAEWREVHNYNSALQLGRELLESLPWCLRILKEMHGRLLLGIHAASATPGEFRRWQVQIGSLGRFIPPPADYVLPLMDNLERYMNTADDRYDPLIQCYIVHYQFEAIHPFVDGNGRVGRALLALMIYRFLGHEMPWLYLSAFFERYKDEYISNLFKVSTEGDWEGWIEFCLNGTISQATDSIQRCARLNELKTEFRNKVSTARPRTWPIIDGLFTEPMLTIPDLARKHGVTYPTARSDVDRLIDAGILVELEGASPKVFFAPAIMNIAFS